MADRDGLCWHNFSTLSLDRSGKRKTYFLPCCSPRLLFRMRKQFGYSPEGSRLPRMKLGRSCKAGRTFLPTSVFPHMQEKRETTAAHSHSYHANFCVGENPQHFAFRIASERGSIHISHLHRSERMFGRKAECIRV